MIWLSGVVSTPFKTRRIVSGGRENDQPKINPEAASHQAVFGYQDALKNHDFTTNFITFVKRTRRRVVPTTSRSHSNGPCPLILHILSAPIQSLSAPTIFRVTGGGSSVLMILEATIPPGGGRKCLSTKPAPAKAPATSFEEVLWIT